MPLNFILPASPDFSPRVDEKGKAFDRDGRWKLNAGSIMVTSVPGLNDDKKGNAQPVAMILDMESARFASERIVALSEHMKHSVIGFWDNLSGGKGGMEGDLHFVKLNDEVEKQVFAESVRLSVLARNGVPIQVSVGAEPGKTGKWEKMDQDSVVCNGRTYTNDTGLPLYVMRGADIFEASLCTFGADSETGRVAASQTQPVRKKETTMSDKLKVLLGKYAEKHHGLVARCVAEGEDETAISTKIKDADHAAALETKDSEITSLKEKLQVSETEIATLKAAAVKTGELKAESKEEKKVLKATGSDKGVTFGSTEGVQDSEDNKAQVKTMYQAMSFVRASNKELKGVALRREARRQFPQAVDG